MKLRKTLSLLHRLMQSKRNERLTAAQLKVRQEAALRRLLHHTWQHSAYYRAQWEKGGITEAALDTLPLHAFPTLEKADLLGHFDTLVTVPDVTQEAIRRFDEQDSQSRDPFRNSYHVVHSSGSTGKPGYFLYDEPAWQTMLAGIVRAALWGLTMPQILKLLVGRPRILFIAATDGRYGGAMAVGDGIDGVGASALNLDIQTPIAQWPEKVAAFRPAMVIGYPSAIKLLAELCEQGKLTMHVDRVVSCGEPLGQQMRQYLEQTLQAVVLNFYGASESLCLGVEQDPREGMLLFDDMNVIEEVGGELYLTCLYNFAQPLIRYHLTDGLTMKPALGKLPFSRAGSLSGRSEDMLWFQDGQGKAEFVHPMAVEGFCIEGLRDYQMHPCSDTALEMLAQAAPSADRETIRRAVTQQMGRILREKHLENVAFSIRFVDEIRPDPHTGKKRLVLRDTPGEWEADACV